MANEKSLLDNLIDNVIEEEEKDFRPGGLESFEVHAAKIREEIRNSFRQFGQNYMDGLSILKEKLVEKGLPVPQINPEALKLVDDPVALEKALQEGKEIYQLLGFSPDTMEQFFVIAQELIKKDDNASAKSVFLFLVTNDSKNAFYWFGLGFANLQLAELNEATRDFQLAVDLDPTFVEGYRGYLHCLIKQNKLNEAIQACEKGLRLASENGDSDWAEPLNKMLSETKNLISKQGA